MPNKELTKELKMRIAEIVMSLTSDGSESEFEVINVNKYFATDAEPEVLLRTHYGVIPDYSLEEKIFDCRTWSLYRNHGKYILQDCSFELSSLPDKLVILESDFKSGNIYIKNDEFTQNLLSNPLGYPLDQVLMIILLSLGRGLMFHACGIDDGGYGYLFLGNSTHGKSTIAKLWSQDCTILNDDRIVVRKKGGRYWMYGTPWHGDYPEISSQGLPIHKIFFLHRGTENSAVPKSGIEAVSMLLTRCFPPIWDKKGMDFTVDFCRRLAEKVPCYELDFVQNKTVVEFVRSLK